MGDGPPTIAHGCKIRKKTLVLRIRAPQNETIEPAGCLIDTLCVFYVPFMSFALLFSLLPTLVVSCVLPAVAAPAGCTGGHDGGGATTPSITFVCFFVVVFVFCPFLIFLGSLHSFRYLT